MQMWVWAVLVGSTGGCCSALLGSAVFFVCTISAHVRADCPHVKGERGAVHSSSSTDVRGLWAVCWTTPTVVMQCLPAVHGSCWGGMPGRMQCVRVSCTGMNQLGFKAVWCGGKAHRVHLPLHVRWYGAHGSTICGHVSYAGGAKPAGWHGQEFSHVAGLMGGSSAPWASHTCILCWLTL